MIDIKLITVSEFFDRKDLTDMVADYRTECAPTFPFWPDKAAYLEQEAAGRLAVFVAEEASGAAIGFIVLLDTSLAHFAGAKFVQIESLYVRPEKRGSSAARWMVEAAEAEARRRGAWSLVMTAAVGSKAEKFFERIARRTGVIFRRDLCPGN